MKIQTFQPVREPIEGLQIGVRTDFPGKQSLVESYHWCCSYNQLDREGCRPLERLGKKYPEKEMEEKLGLCLELYFQVLSAPSSVQRHLIPEAKSRQKSRNSDPGCLVQLPRVKFGQSIRQDFVFCLADFSC